MSRAALSSFGGILLVCAVAACSGTDAVSIPDGPPPASDGTPGGAADKQPATGNGEKTPPGQAPPGAPGGPAAKAKRVFVTAQLYKGDLRQQGQDVDGFRGGDKLCQAEAQAHQLGGTWKAFLSGHLAGETVKAVDRLAEVGPWFLVDGTTKVFEGKRGLTSAPLAKIDMLPDGKKTGDEPLPWTGTRSDFGLDASCERNGSSWSSSSGSREGTFGNAADLGRWLEDSTHDCDEPAPLYCFEQ
jgi:hypothetical protein